MKYTFRLSIILMLFIKMVSAQTTPVSINVKFENARIEDVVKAIESQSKFTIYYNENDFDSLRVTLSVDKTPVNQVLDLAFKNTDYSYSIFYKQIYLTKGNKINTEIAAGYYNFKHNQVPANSPDLQLAEENTTNTKQVVKANLENKVYEIGLKSSPIKPGSALLTGYIKDSKSGSPLAGVSIYVEAIKRGGSSDQFGHYALTLPRGRNILSIKGIGLRDTKRQIILYGDGKLDIELIEQVISLKEVVISGQKAANVKRVQMGVNKLDIKSIKQVPTVFGEADVLKVVLTLPGVKSVGEASSGFNVRGGSSDQNLILLNDATIYNPSHFFGFFSSFNPDLVSNVDLYKSSIPEKFGGRLSSVLDVSNREGNKKKFTGTAGIGLITSRLSLEAPLLKDRSSIIFGGRTTYSNWLLKLLPEDYKHSKASFYDFNLDINHKINDKNNIYLTTYVSNDEFSLNSDTSYNYNNKNASVKWKHTFNNKLYGLFTTGVDQYKYKISSLNDRVNGYTLNFDINQINLKSDFNYYLNPKHSLNFGFTSVLYKLNPGTLKPGNATSLTQQDVMPTEQGLESAFYIGDKFDISNRFSVNMGLRYSIFNSLGPQTVFNYASDLPKTSTNLLDSSVIKSGGIAKTYHGPEIRLSARYNVTDDFSLKASYNSLRQYIHLLSNTTAIAPTDVWKLSDPNIKPQIGDQASFGMYQNFKSNTIETSVEVYYKRMKDYLDYRSGANLVLNHHIETDVLSTEGKAYGVEFLIKKSTGKLNGWISYTYSRTLLRQSDSNAGETINKGNYYPANFDKPHDFNFIGNYRLSHRFSASLNVTYSTGRPITLPVGKYYYAGSQRVLYSDRNAYRIPDYFRTDFSMNIEGNHKVKQLTHNSWNIGIYNLTGRQNAYSTYFTSQNGSIKGYKLSIFATSIPFINYNIRF